MMHNVTVNGVSYDLCHKAVSEMFSEGSVTLRGKGQLFLDRYSLIRPVPRLHGAVHYCDAHGSTSNCP